MIIAINIAMITVQMTLEPELVKRFDRRSKKLGLSRSALARIAFEEFLSKTSTAAKEKQHRAGYTKKRSGSDLSGWETEQVWPA